MARKLLCTIIFAGLVAGLVTAIPQSQTPKNDVTHQANRSDPQNQPQAPIVIRTPKWFFGQRNNSAGYTPGYPHFTAGTTGRSQHTTGKKQSTSNPYHQSTAGEHKVPTNQSADQHHTDQPQVRTSNYKATPQKQQSVSESKVQLSSDQVPDRNEHKTTESFSNVNIPDQVFLCNDGKFRIYSSSKCNGKIDCPDGSDELPSLCQNSSKPLVGLNCHINQFKCPTGKCISEEDNIKLSDKECWGTSKPNKGNLKNICPDHMLLCDKNTQCVSTKNRCDGTHDCQDKSDEAACYGHKVNTERPYDPCYDNPNCNSYTDCEGDSCDESTSSWKDSKTFIITISVLGGTLFITIIIVASVIIYYRRKYKALTGQLYPMEKQPPSYWQFVGNESLVSEKQQKNDNAVQSGMSVLPA